jgi:DNA-binding response OmpR family regulator
MPLTPISAARVLVVEDDELIRDIIGCTLADAGLEVSTAPTAWVALDMLDRDEFALVVTDFALPDGLDGLELVRYARSRHPSLRSLFVSGCTEPIGDDPDLDNFVAKPFWKSELLGCVWELLCREVPRSRLACSSSRLAELAIVEAKVRCLRPQHRRMPPTTRRRRQRRRQPTALVPAAPIYTRIPN